MNGREVNGMAGGGYDLDEIRRRASIVEIVSPHVALRKAGRRLTGLCPFHQERTPSFTVDPETNLWHCFGCKAGGDLFRFVEMVEKVTFAEAVEMLARRLGVQPRSPEQAGRRKERDRLLELHEAAAAFFQAQLKSPVGRHSRSYLERRGVSPAAIEAFSIGYAPPEWDWLAIALGKRGYAGAELEKAGLVIPRSDGSLYDRFRDRVMFPIRDTTGRIIAFGGRTLGDDQQPKYMNSPENPLFHKGHTLYAFDRARQAMSDSGQAIIVEGYLDVIACHDSGFAETVATMGTALTADHVEMLRRRVSRLVLAFDADSAGMGAALRSRDMFEQAGLVVRVVTLPDGLDPDQVVRERGREAFASLVTGAAPMIEWELTGIYDRLQGLGEADRLQGMREAVARLARLPAGVEREYYIRWLVDRWGAGTPARAAEMEAAVREELARTAARRRESGRRRQGPASSEGAEAASFGGATDQQLSRRSGTGPVQGQLLALLVKHGEAGVPYLRQLEAADFPAGLREVFEAVRGLAERDEKVTVQSVLAGLSADSRGVLAELLVGDLPGERVEQAISSGVARVLEARLVRQIAELSQRFGEAKSREEQEHIGKVLSEARRQRSELAGQRLVGSE